MGVEVVAAGAAAGDDPEADAGGRCGFDDLANRRPHRGGRRGALRTLADVLDGAGIGLQSAQAQRGMALDPLCQCQHRNGIRRPGAPIAGRVVDQHVQRMRQRAGGRSQVVDVAGVIHDHHEVARRRP